MATYTSQTDPYFYTRKLQDLGEMIYRLQAHKEKRRNADQYKDQQMLSDAEKILAEEGPDSPSLASIEGQLKTASARERLKNAIQFHRNPEGLGHIERMAKMEQQKLALAQAQLQQRQVGARGAFLDELSAQPTTFPGPQGRPIPWPRSQQNLRDTALANLPPDQQQMLRSEGVAPDLPTPWDPFGQGVPGTAKVAMAMAEGLTPPGAQEALEIYTKTRRSPQQVTLSGEKEAERGLSERRIGLSERQAGISERKLGLAIRREERISKKAEEVASGDKSGTVTVAQIQKSIDDRLKAGVLPADDVKKIDIVSASRQLAKERGIPVARARAILYLRIAKRYPFLDD